MLSIGAFGSYYTHDSLVKKNDIKARDEVDPISWTA